MNRSALLVLALVGSVASAEETVGSVGTIRADYLTRFSNLEVNVGLSALPIFDVELGINLSTSEAHAAIGPRFEVLPRRTETGFAVKLVALLAGSANLGSPVGFSGVGVIPGVEGSFWFSRNFGVTGAISVPVLVPYDSRLGLNGPGTLASPRLGLGLAF